MTKRHTTTIYPYCDCDKPVTDFLYRNWLVLGRGPEPLMRGDRTAEYVVMKDYEVIVVVGGEYHTIVVPAGMTTDLASVPRIFRGLVGQTGPHLEACVVHDWLYIAWQIQDRLPTKADWKFANQVLYAGMKAAGCSWFTRMAVKVAMKTPFVSWSVFKSRDKNLFVSLEGFRCLETIRDRHPLPVEEEYTR